MIVGGFVAAVSTEKPEAAKWLWPLNGCWIAFIGWFIRHPDMHSRLTRAGRLALMYSPFLMGYSFAHGYDAAVHDLAMPRGEYRIVHSTNLVEDNIQLLRATSKGVLILRLPAKDVSFLTYQSFKRIDWTGAAVEE